MGIIQTGTRHIVQTKHWFVTASRKRKIIVVCGVLVLVILGGYFLLGKRSQKPQYQTAQVERGDIISTLSESGNVTSGSQVNVTSPTDGVITEVYVQNGDQVTAGENLFKVSSTATPEDKAKAYANYLSAQNSLNDAKAKMNSLQAALFKTNQAFVTDKGTANPDTSDPTYIQEKANWQQAEADYTNQNGVIAQAQAALTSAAFSYQATQDSVVTAPIDGTIANLAGTIGSNVSASGGGTSGSNSSATGSSSNAFSSSSSSATSGSTVLVIGNFSNLNVTVQASEVDVPQIHAGQKATITLDAFSDKTFVGTVTSVDTIGTTSSGVVTYNVHLSFIAPPSDIKPGMTASVTIQTNRKDNVLTVPSTAIQTTNGESTVRVMKNGAVTQVPVEIGIASDTDTEITSGLSEGDTVVTSIITPIQGRGSTQTASPFGGGFGGGRGFGGGGGGRAGGARFITR